MHLAEGRRGLLHVAEFDLTLEESRDLHQVREDHRQLADDEVPADEGDPHVDDPPVVLDDLRESRHQTLVLDSLSAVERDVLGAVAYPDECVAEVRGEAFLPEVEPDEGGTTDTEGHDAGHEHIHQHQPHHHPWDLDAEERDRPRQVPEDLREGDDGRERRQYAVG